MFSMAMSLYDQHLAVLNIAFPFKTLGSISSTHVVLFIYLYLFIFYFFAF